MKFDKFLLLLCLMILLVLSLSMVSANDNVTNSHDEISKFSNDNSNNMVDEAVNDKDTKKKSNLIEDDTNVSVITKKYESNVKETDYVYDEDEEYGFTQGSYVMLSYDKVKTNQYNISAEIYNSYGNPVKEGEITVYFDMGSGKYPAKTLSFRNGSASFIQKFHTNGRVKIYSKDIHNVLYESKNTGNESQLSSSNSYTNTVVVKSDILAFNVETAYVNAYVPDKSDIAEKVKVLTYAYDDDILSNEGTVYVYVDDKLVQSKKVKNGNVNFSLSIKKVGKHMVEVDYKTGYGETFYDTNVVEITRKKEKITLSLPGNGDTREEIVITTKVVNDTQKLNRGYVLLKSNGKKIATAKVKDGETTTIYRLPYISGSYIITAEYKYANKSLASDSKEINVYDVESLYYDTIGNSTTGSKIVFKATVFNPHITVNYGSVKVYLGDKLLFKKAVKNDMVSQTITIPNKSGTYTLEVQYIKQNSIINQKKNNIKITDSERLSYKIPKRLLPDNKYTFKVKVTSPNGIVNSGQVKYKLGSKIVTAKVKKGIATISLKTIRNEKNLTATVSYLKYDKVVDKKSSTVEHYYTYKSYTYPPWDTIKGTKIKISTDVYTKKGIKATSGKVIFTINNKKIGTAKVKKGEAVLYYKTNLKPGIYKVSSTYYDKNNKKVAAESYDYMTVVNKLTNDKNTKIKTFIPSYDYDDSNEVSIGSSEYLNAYYSWGDSKYNEYISLTNSYWYYPKYNRLVKARYYYLSNGKTITKTYGESDLMFLYRFTTESKNAPYKVEIAYRKMNAQEKNYMKYYFGIKY